MKPIIVTRLIQAPIEHVFEAVSDVRIYSQSNPAIKDIEFLTESRKGVGTRFVESRLMQGKLHKTELEITEHVANRKVRMVNDGPSTVWDTTFTTEATPEGTRYTLAMDARGKGPFTRFFNRLIRGMVAKQVEKDTEGFKDFCEQPKVDAAD